MKRQLILAFTVTGLTLPAMAGAQTVADATTARPHGVVPQHHPVDAQHHPVGGQHHATAVQQHAVDTPRHAVDGQHHAVAAPQQPTGAVRVMTGAVETKITSGRPYSAEAVTEAVQVLADGNRISRGSVTRVYRDGAGRTRRETLADDGSVRTIAISDPVAHTSYTLDPKTKVAYQAGGNIITPTFSGTYTLTTRRDGAEQERQTVTTARGRGVGGGGGTGTGAGAGAGGGGRGAAATFERTPRADNPNARKEDLGPQNIEGVMATGSRTTTTIPPGEIGNLQEIRIVSEQWFSDDLQVLVMTKHSDPRSGENTYRLRNIVRAEPDPSLFTVPADYTLQQRGVRSPQ